MSAACGPLPQAERFVSRLDRWSLVTGEVGLALLRLGEAEEKEGGPLATHTGTVRRRGGRWGAVQRRQHGWPQGPEQRAAAYQRGGSVSGDVARTAPPALTPQLRQSGLVMHDTRRAGTAFVRASRIGRKVRLGRAAAGRPWVPGAAPGGHVGGQPCGPLSGAFFYNNHNTTQYGWAT